MAKPSRPPSCGVRGCCGTLKEKEVNGVDVLVCDLAAHHRAWLVSDAAGLSWEFSTRGRAYLKGKVFDKASWM